MPCLRCTVGKNSTNIKIVNIKAIYGHYLALIGFFGLFGLLMLWHTVFVPPVKLPVALVLLFTVTPLLLPMRGLLNANRKSCAWAAYLSLFYFSHGAIEAYSNANERIYALFELIFSLFLFFGVIIYLRLTKKT